MNLIALAAGVHRQTDSTGALDGWTWVRKDIQDRAIAIVILVLCGVPMLIIGAAIKLSSPGPVLFRQIRRGYGCRAFRVLPHISR
jgi:putative colanic acid biosysnthesis UDP-glucose lipid carrier transferase